VNLDHVAALVDQENGRLEVQLADGTKLMASRSRSKELKDLAL
jgi:DNA-binding LytR/AlgR family response regulator